MRAEDLMRRELDGVQPCHHCGEPRRAHYSGVLLGCRQGRTIFRPSTIVALQVDQLQLDLGPQEGVTRHG